MILSKLREISTKYEQTWYTRKWIVGDHNWAQKFKEYLAGCEDKADNSALSSDDIYQLLRKVPEIIEKHSNLEMIHYQDDLLIVCETKRQLVRCKQRLIAVLKESELYPSYQTPLVSRGSLVGCNCRMLDERRDINLVFRGLLRFTPEGASTGVHN